MTCARHNPAAIFELTPIGCGLAGYEKEQIAPLFISAPRNFLFTREWIYD